MNDGGAWSDYWWEEEDLYHSTTSVDVDSWTIERLLQNGPPGKKGGETPIVFTILPLLPSLLSLIGSSFVLYFILRREVRKNAYKRLVFGLICFNILNAVQFPLHSVVNDCKVVGFLNIAALAGPIYNGMLSCYFLLTIRHGVNDAVMSRRYEPWMHAIAIGYPLALAIVGLVIDPSYHKKGSGHFCLIGLKQNVIYVMVIPVVMIWFWVIVNHVLIYAFVKETIRRTKTYVEEYSKTASASMSGPLDQSSQQRRHRLRGLLRYTIDKRVRGVAKQGMMYVIAFFICQSTPSVLLTLPALDNLDGKKIFPYLYGITCLLFPLQGFLNFLIYIRPTYMKCREDHPDETKFWALKRVILGAQWCPKSPRQSQMRLKTPEDNHTGETEVHPETGEPNQQETNACEPVEVLSLDRLSGNSFIDDDDIDENDQEDPIECAQDNFSVKSRRKRGESMTEMCSQVEHAWKYMEDDVG